MSKERNNFATPLHLACADDEIRPALECVHFIDDFAYATDGSILVKQSLKEYCNVLFCEELNGHAIHKDSFANILKFENAEANPDGVECWDEGGKKAFFPYKDTQSVGWNVPNFESVLGVRDPLPTKAIGINPKYFGIAEKVLAHSNGCMRCTLQGMNKALILEYDCYPGQVVYVMTMTIEELLF